MKLSVLLSWTLVASSCGTTPNEIPTAGPFEMPDLFVNDKKYQDGFKSLTEVIHEQILDPYIARIGYPVGDKVRVWIKLPVGGNATLYRGDEKTIGPETRITEDPLFSEDEFGTRLFELPEEISVVTVVFSDEQGKQVATRVLRPKALGWFEADSSQPYSLAFYGCYAPFTKKSEKDPIEVFESETDNADSMFSTRFEQLFASNALGDGNGILPNLKLIVGTGDQAYVDLGYGYEPGSSKPHPISGWDDDKVPRPRTSPERYIEHIDRMYRSAFSFRTMNTIFAEIPHVNVWDDHEIRDGWGSHGDEYIDCNDVEVGKGENPRKACKPQPQLWEHYFLPAKRGFIQHQYALGNVATDELIRRIEDAAKKGPQATARGRQTMQQKFRIGDLEGFAFDLRTQRSINTHEVAGREQIKDFEEWVAEVIQRRRDSESVDDDQMPVVIVSSMPMFLRQLEAAKKAVIKVNAKGLRDDLRDSWSVWPNTNERDEILGILVRNNIRPIFVSGDYHRSVMAEIHMVNQNCEHGTRLNDCSRVWGYEIIASGLRHEKLPDSREQRLIDVSDAQKWSDHYIDLGQQFVGDDSYHSDQSVVKPRLDLQVLEVTTAQNFASITVEPATEGKPDSQVIMQLIQASEAKGDTKASVEVVRRVGRWGHKVKRCTGWFAFAKHGDDPSCDIVSTWWNLHWRLRDWLPNPSYRRNTRPGLAMGAECARFDLQEFDNVNLGNATLTKEQALTDWRLCGT